LSSNACARSLAASEEFVDVAAVGRPEVVRLRLSRHAFFFPFGPVPVVDPFNAGQQFPELVLDRPGLLGQFDQIEVEPGQRDEGFQDGQRRLGKREPGEQVRHLAEQAGPRQPGLRRRPEQYTVEPADVPLFEQLDLQALQLLKVGVIGRRPEYAGPVRRVHLRGHGGERDHSFDPGLAGERHELLAEGEPPDRRLGLAQKDDQVVLPRRVPP
jgi:hypothetical protein